ncbi:conserved Plasmodium protein, unknown function [Plasmodium knowlesi strain H]|uniref:Cyclin-dependent kinases regulatory subunit n=3 Tax=Plasmodium knowlesi TaxID=5850 RepID=A0A5K1UAL4_PLAKH|nr:cyclin-dependent kinases regulatory subunit, putative [Plasmodium knowlesi strain H]OTN66146.1 Cyclin-dependent kinases regulatory subunit [Plasmodium knowlesi]CAA9986343.1 cyclin-dependent kinases regulatory subunit, putative [Plasmodium knowlesi strain H]SBO25590.1 conserved Plasmodium protein, unknown function [Plasmodium knowlesi strain H]SBO28327.1 conserved Plasmodium protein, unknown function [Plasmodium knowlesi strain H]VVS75817.1 cyclin-dependent kinases regulatory subunit, putati|eukprot:XP_002257748.1 hypothetical protein, conserved in Plasmodium species [Plasmodium knowlesi strain H]
MSFDNIGCNMNLSIHKIFSARYSAPNKVSDDCKPVAKKRRCTISLANEPNAHQRNHIDYLNYNFNNAFTKRRKYSSPYSLTNQNKKFTPLKCRTQLRSSVDESIKKSAAVRSIVKKTMKKNKSEIYEHNEQNYLNMSKAYYLNRLEGAGSTGQLSHPGPVTESNHTIGNPEMTEHRRNLNETYILSSTTQSENTKGYINTNADSQNTFRETLPMYINSESTISSFNLDRELENKLYLEGVAPNGNAKGALRISQEERDVRKKADMYKTNAPVTDYGARYRPNHLRKDDEERKKIIESHPRKRRHTTQFLRDQDRYNYSDSNYLNIYTEGEMNHKSSTRRHSDAIRCKSLNGLYYSDVTNEPSVYSFRSEALPQSYNSSRRLDASRNSQQKECYTDKDSDNPLFHTCFFKNAEEFENGDIKRKENVEPMNPNEEDDSVLKNDAEYLFSTGFFKDIYSNIQRKGELNFIDELLEADDEYYISKTKLNKIIENAKNKEMKYHYIDRMFLYRHAKNVIDDADYETYRNKCRTQHKYLDVPFPNLTELMNLKSVGIFDEVDDTDEYYHAEVKLLEKYYYTSRGADLPEEGNLQKGYKDKMKMPTPMAMPMTMPMTMPMAMSRGHKGSDEEVVQNGDEVKEEDGITNETIVGREVLLKEEPCDGENPIEHMNKLENMNQPEQRIVLSSRNGPFNDSEYNDDLSDREKREKLICVMNKMKREKDSFFERILDAPDFSKILEPVFSLNESFLLSHQLFNVQYAAQLGPVVYLIKTEDEHYVYRAIEVSRLFEEKVKSILDNQKANGNSKDRNDYYDCFSNEKFPFLHELDVKYYLRIPMSTGWNHFGYLKNQNNVLFFRRRKNT